MLRSSRRLLYTTFLPSYAHNKKRTFSFRLSLSMSPIDGAIVIPRTSRYVPIRPEDFPCNPKITLLPSHLVSSFLLLAPRHRLLSAATTRPTQSFPPPLASATTHHLPVHTLSTAPSTPNLCAPSSRPISCLSRALPIRPPVRSAHPVENPDQGRVPDHCRHIS
jgi:hypothetical protein